MRRALGVLAALVLLGGVTYALIPDPDPEPRELVKVNGLIGSEKRAFFENQQVKDELAKQGLEVHADSTGSWTMVDKAKQPGLDFAFPASASPVKEIQRIWGLQDSPLVPFYSPLVVLTHEPVAQVLRQNALATQDDSGVWTFKMDDYLAALKSGRRWQDLAGAAAHPELSGTIFVTTTDPESSSSGAMYIALLSYVLNNRHVVSDQAGVDATKDVLRTATALQGGQKSSSDEPFKDFSAGVGNPLVFAYESQVAELAMNGTSTGDMVVLYPDTTIYSDHTLVARNEKGAKLASLLQEDEQLRTLEARFGFRPQADPSAFAKAVKDFRKPVFAPDLTAAKVKQPQVPAQDFLLRLVAAAKGKAVQ
ncbi:hypothetical protein F7Q99_05595 [Streptomyces kaniharaensis]|uniref:Extracellular solute-binding protein n=1 Tax=Streptomyces kaniharaensis TaxID=212423 RepID=A0A6N7KK13_9ACTN|nr:hypothetical protein [Streptomyces kaniharaensis]MQS11776.1 hypothetical protein [Streptomyces kaniharaensis]